MRVLIIICATLLFIGVVLVAPLKLFPEEMANYGTYLAGLAAMIAAFKYVMPYILIFIYRERYSNELILKKLFNISIEASDDGRIPQTGYLLGVIESFKYLSGDSGYTKNDNWYEHLIDISIELNSNLGNTAMCGASTNKKFNDIKSKLSNIASKLAQYTSPAKPNLNEEEKIDVCKEFKLFVDAVKDLESVVKEVPMPVKTIINANEFYKSFIKS